MRLHRIVVLLAATVLVSTANGSIAKMTQPNLPAVARSFAAAQHDAPAKRMLRIDSPVVNDEERGFTDKIAGLAKSVEMKWDLRTLLKNGKSSDDALAYLKLDSGVDGLLSNPKLNNLAKYISKYNKKFPESKVTMVGTLTKQYGDDAVAGMLVAGLEMKSPDAKAMAQKLQGEQFRLWHDDGKSYGQVFELLKLKEAANPLKGDVFAAWRSYMDVYNKHAGELKTTELEVLRSVYSDRDLAALLVKVKFDPESGITVMNLERGLYNSWVEKKVAPGKLLKKVFGLKPGAELTRYDNAVLSEYKRWWWAAAAK